jgi:two-component system, cell cycle response regulator DivK
VTDFPARRRYALIVFRDCPLVLLVDDHEDSLAMYAAYLASRGVATMTADDGEAALIAARNVRPDLVVTDLRVPGVSGLELIRLWRAEHDATRLGIIVLTGCAFASDQQEALAAGCDAYLVKPCPPDLLIREINRVLAGANRARTASLAFPPLYRHAG